MDTAEKVSCGRRRSVLIFVSRRLSARDQRSAGRESTSRGSGWLNGPCCLIRSRTNSSCGSSLDEEPQAGFYREERVSAANNRPCACNSVRWSALPYGGAAWRREHRRYEYTGTLCIPPPPHVALWVCVSESVWVWVWSTRVPCNRSAGPPGAHTDDLGRLIFRCRRRKISSCVFQHAPARSHSSTCPPCWRGPGAGVLRAAFSATWLQSFH